MNDIIVALVVCYALPLVPWTFMFWIALVNDAGVDADVRRLGLRAGFAALLWPGLFVWALQRWIRGVL